MKLLFYYLEVLYEMTEELIFPITRFLDRFFKKIEGNDRIILLRQKEVLQWIFGDTSFLPPSKGNPSKSAETSRLKPLEDKWGNSMSMLVPALHENIKRKNPEEDKTRQWTGPFGEQICKELYILLNENPKRISKESLEIDFETDSCMIEVKTQTYFTTGTAGEKIMAVPFKYRNVLDIYGKPLKIVCVGGAERLGRFQYGILDNRDDNAAKLLDFYKNELGIEFVGIRDLLKPLILN